MQRLVRKGCHNLALERIDEAGAENKLFNAAIFVQGDAGSRCTRSNQGHLSAGYNRFCCSYAAAGSRTNHGYYLILGNNLGYRVAGFSRLRFIIALYQADLFTIYTAGFIGFVNCHLESA